LALVVEVQHLLSKEHQVAILFLAPLHLMEAVVAVHLAQTKME
jgi:hypothetical protein